MNTETLARLQFALTVSFHYLFPPLSIGLGITLVIMEAIWLKTKDQDYKNMARFWVRIFSLIFGLGVATGIVMEFEFGTNWAAYSRYVGDIFGSALAAEGVFAFFLESGFLALLVFGWDRISPKLHFFSTCMVALGSTFSAVWIVVANSWMQTPAGYQIVQTPMGPRAHITDFWQMVFNPSSVDRLLHVVDSAYITAAFLVTSVSAYYLLKGRHIKVAQMSMKIGLGLAMIATLLQFVTGDQSVRYVAKYQPAKMAAMEGHFHSSRPLGLTLFGWVDPANQTVHGLTVPRVGSYLLTWNPTNPVEGLNSIPKNDQPMIQPVFQLYHLMVLCGIALFAVAFWGGFLWIRGALFQSKWFLKVLIYSVALPQIATQAGWFTAELGRQPWIVYGMMRTSAALSKAVKAGEILSSLILFTVIYLLLGALFFYLLNKRIQTGPEDVSNDSDLATTFNPTQVSA